MTTNSPNPVDGDVQACKPKRIDHSKLAAEIVHNLVSTDSCDEEVTEKLILWVINRLNKEFPTPPAQLLRPVELPDELTPKAASRAYGGQVEGYRDGWNACLAEVQRLNAKGSHDIPKNLNWLLELSKACHVIGVPVRLSDSQVEAIGEAFRELEQHLNATAQPVSAPEWTNEQCLEFLSIAFRHANISGDIEMDDIRLGIRMVNAAAPGGQDD